MTPEEEKEAEIRRALASMTPEPVETQVVARLGQENFVGNPAFMDGRWVHPPAPGTHVDMERHRDGFARNWPDDEPPYESPVVSDPIVRATLCTVEVATTRTGSVKSVGISGPLDPMPEMPTGAKTALKRLVALAAKAHAVGSDIDLVVTYARGYDINAKGEMKRKAITVKNTPDENDPRTRIKIGEEEPVPVDSWLLRGIWRASEGIGRIVGGWWVDGKPDSFQIWEPATGLRVLENVTIWSKELDGYAGA